MAQAVTNPEAAVPAAVEPCPRCQQPLIDPKGLGWCKACGFCKSLEDEQTKALLAEAPVAAPAAAPVNLNQLPGTKEGFLANFPVWAAILLVGIVAIPAACYYVQHETPLTPEQRALWTSIQIGASTVALLLGHLIVLMRLAPEESSLSFKDIVIPFNLYAMMLKHLPRTQIGLYLSIWASTSILSVTLIVGGLEYWMKYLPKAGDKSRPAATKKR